MKPVCLLFTVLTVCSVASGRDSVERWKHNLKKCETTFRRILNKVTETETTYNEILSGVIQVEQLKNLGCGPSSSSNNDYSEYKSTYLNWVSSSFSSIRDIRDDTLVRQCIEIIETESNYPAVVLPLITFFKESYPLDVINMHLEKIDDLLKKLNEIYLRLLLL